MAAKKPKRTAALVIAQADKSRVIAALARQTVSFRFAANKL
jgi:hypothetical protein